MQTADDYRAMWDTIERLWSEAVARARRLPESARQERVDDEWSFVETLRHLVFATDAWASRTVLDDPMPYDRLGYTHSGYPPADAAAIGVDLDARPSFDEVMEVRADRMASMRRIVDGLTDEELDAITGRWRTRYSGSSIATCRLKTWKIGSSFSSRSSPIASSFAGIPT